MRNRFALLSFGFISLVQAQQAIVTGRITDALAGTSLIGVNVIAGPGLGTATDADGNYRLTLDPGERTITFSFLGFMSQTRKLTLQAGQEERLDIALSTAATQLDMVVVTAGKFEQRVGEVSQSLSVLRPEVIQNKNITNVSEVLGQVPGVVIIDEDPQIRASSGFSYGAGSRVMVLVDDLPVLSGDIGRTSWSLIPTENLEQLEVIKGASSVLYGSAALSGVINVRTAYPKEEPTTRVNVFAGMYDGPRNKAANVYEGRNQGMAGTNFFHSQRFGQWDVVLGANLVWDEGFLGPESVGKDTLNREDPKYSEPAGYDRRVRLNGGVRYRHKKVKGLNYGINANAVRAENTSVFIWDDADTNIYRAENGTVTHTRGFQYYVDPYINYLSAQRTRHSLRGRYLSQAFDNSGNQSNASHFIYGEYQVQQRLDLWGETVLTGGLVGQSTRSFADLYNGNPDNSSENMALNTSAYLQVDKKFFKERLVLSGGVRYESFKVNDDQQSVPVYRAGATGRVARGTFLRASYGQGYRFPTIGERYINTNVGQLNIFPNPGLKPEESWNVEGGIKQGFKVGGFTGYLDLVAFQQDFQNYIEFTFGFWKLNPQDLLSGIGFKSVNTGGARVRGLEAELAGKGKIGNVDLAILMGYTWTKPVSTTPSQDYATPAVTTIPAYDYLNTSYDTTGYLLKFRVQHLFRADVQAEYWKLFAGVSVRYNSHVRNIDKVFVTLDETTSEASALRTGVGGWMKEHKTGDTILDARIGFKLGENNRIAFIVNNLTNLTYAIRPLSVESPRTFQLQLSRSI
ncbi:MAG: TonB-dependent receptor [Flavobacteriales bacterium]|nr:TonB-dependent receptor [Flavobacteriales bacterium]